MNLEENDLDQYISKEVLEPKGYERIIAYSIKDHLIPHVPSNTLKESFSSLMNLFEGNIINKKMTLRNELEYVKIQNLDTMQSYYTWVVEFKEQIEAFKEEEDIIMTTLSRSHKEVGYLQRTLGRVHTRRSSTHNNRIEHRSNKISISHDL